MLKDQTPYSLPPAHTHTREGGSHTNTIYPTTRPQTAAAAPAAARGVLARQGGGGGARGWACLHLPQLSCQLSQCHCQLSRQLSRCQGAQEQAGWLAVN